MSLNRNYIPYKLRIQFTQIEPKLDYEWEKNLQDLFTKLTASEKDNVNEQILKNKNIVWNSETDTFTHRHTSNLLSLNDEISHSGMKILIKKIISSLDELNKYSKISDIADYLETILKQIDNIDVEENIELLRTKQKIRIEFIYQSAQIIKHKSNLEVPINSRKLTAEAIKCYILEVFLKHELLDFWFKTIRPRQLKEQSYSLLNNFLFNEQRIRQLEVIKTSKFIYAIAPSRSADINTFSIRRFLNEEKIVLSNNVYLNGAVIPLENLTDLEFIESFHWQVNRIVTIEKQVSTIITDLVDSFEQINAKTLLPLLFEPLDSSGLAADKIIEQRLWDFEQQLSIQILEPLESALRNLATRNEEYDYLFVSIRQIFGDINSYYKDFQQQPAMMFNNHVNLFSARLIAYLTMIEKRKNEIFIAQTNEDYQANLTKLSESITILRNLSKDSLDKLRILRVELKASQKLLKDNENSFLSKLFNNTKKLNIKVDELKNDIYENRENTYFEIVRIPKKFQKDTVYLEFESLISINDLERHYAFSSGENWVRRLPILVQLPEDRNLLNIQELYNTLEFDLSKMNQKWAELNYLK